MTWGDILRMRERRGEGLEQTGRKAEEKHPGVLFRLFRRRGTAGVRQSGREKTRRGE